MLQSTPGKPEQCGGRLGVARISGNSDHDPLQGDALGSKCRESGFGELECLIQIGRRLLKRFSRSRELAIELLILKPIERYLFSWRPRVAV